MPLYFFNVSCDAFDARDTEGEVCRDIAAARAGAIAAAGALIRDELALGGLPRAGWIDIEDARRRRVLRLPLLRAAS